MDSVYWIWVVHAKQGRIGSILGVKREEKGKKKAHRNAFTGKIVGIVTTIVDMEEAIG